MRYIIISDVHGQYDKMIEALTSVNFNKDKDYLIVNGDTIDRGPQVRRCIEYILKCPNHICIWGNHEHLLDSLLRGERFFNSYIDVANGALATFKSYGCHNWIDMIDFYPIEDRFASLRRYLRTCVNAVVIGKYAISHAAIPLNIEAEDNEGWENLSATDSIIWYRNEGHLNSKTCVIGHFWARLFRKELHLDNPDSNDLLEYKNLVALDGCSNLPQGKVNAFVIESDDEVIIY